MANSVGGIESRFSAGRAASCWDMSFCSSDTAYDNVLWGTVVIQRGKAPEERVPPTSANRRPHKRSGSCGPEAAYFLE